MANRIKKLAEDNVIQQQGNIAVLAENILNYYYNRIYQGSEHEYISLRYLDLVFWNLVQYLGDNGHYTLTDNNSRFKGWDFMKTQIRLAKKDTVQEREGLLQQWKDNLNNRNFISNNKFKMYLHRNYKKLSDENQVKVELGLDSSKKLVKK